MNRIVFDMHRAEASNKATSVKALTKSKLHITEPTGNYQTARQRWKSNECKAESNDANRTTRSIFGCHLSNNVPTDILG